MEIKFNENWHLNRSVNIHMWQNSSDIVFIDIATYDAIKLFEVIFGVKILLLPYGEKNYDFINATLDALKEDKIKDYLAYILIKTIDKILIGSWLGLKEKKLGKRRYLLFTKLEKSFQINFESTQGMALSEMFKITDLKTNPENNIESEIFKLLIDNYDLVRKITKEYED